MGIAAILTAAVKQVSWGKLATVAIQYGPDLIKKLKGQVRLRDQSGDEESVTVDELIEEIAGLRAVILNQEKIIEASNGKINLLEQNCKSLQTRLKLFMSLAAVSVVASVVLCIMLFTR